MNLRGIAGVACVAVLLAGCEGPQGSSPRTEEYRGLYVAHRVRAVSGQLVNPAGQPIVGARIGLEGWDAKGAVALEVQTTTGPNGDFAFAVEGVAVCDLWVRAWICRNDRSTERACVHLYRDGIVAGIALGAVHASEDEGLGAALEVVVRADGKPVPGATVFLTLADGNWAFAKEAFHFRLTTTAEGRVWRHSTKSTVEVTVQKSGFVSETRSIGLGGHDTRLVVDLERATPLRGRVFGPDGRPEAGALVSAYGLQPDTLREAREFGSARTDADGVYVIEEVPPISGERPVSLWVRGKSDDQVVPRRVLTTRPVGAVDHRLVRAGRLALQLPRRGPGTRDGVYDVDFELERRNELGAWEPFLRDPSELFFFQRTRRLAEGVAFDAEGATFEHLVPGEYRVVSWGSGTPRTEPLEVTSGRTSRVIHPGLKERPPRAPQSAQEPPESTQEP